MMRLWGRKSSINVQKVLWCLAELGLKEGKDFERIDAGLHFGVNNTPEFLKLNPNGLVPTLEDGDVVLWESNTIMRYLVSQYDKNNRFPKGVAAQYSSEKMMDWQLATLWPPLRTAFLGLTRTPEKDRDYDAIYKGYQATNKTLGLLDNILSSQDYCSGNQFHLGDIVVALVEDHEATLKRFRRKGGMIALEAANPAYAPICLPAEEVTVQGRLVAVWRQV